MQVEGKRKAVKAEQDAQGAVEIKSPNQGEQRVSTSKVDLSAPSKMPTTGAVNSTEGEEGYLGLKHRASGSHAGPLARNRSGMEPRCSSRVSDTSPFVPVMIATPVDGSAALEEATCAATIVQQAVRAHQDPDESS
jgi:hypothetical protein